MNRTSQCTGTSIDQSTTIDFSCSHPLAHLLKVATSTTLSVEARLLYVILCLMAWSKGRCWPGQAYQAKALGRSDRQIRRYHQELEKAGVLRIDRRAGRSSYYYPRALDQLQDTSDTPTPDTRVPLTLKKELQNVKHVVRTPTQITKTPPSARTKNVNALIFTSDENRSYADEKLSSEPCATQTSPSESSLLRIQPTRLLKTRTPPLTPDNLFLVEEIERVTGDTWSRAHFVNMVRQFNEQTIYAALSITKEKLALESGVNGGAYFTTTLRGMAGIQSLGTPPTSSTPSPPHKTTPQSPIPPRSTPLPESEPLEEIDVVALIKGWKIMYQPGRVQSVLFQVAQCLQDWDVTGAWYTLQQDRAGLSEPEVLAEFLELAAFKVKFQSTAREVEAT